MRTPTRQLWASRPVLALWLTCGLMLGQQVDVRSDGFETTIEPLLQDWCISCHEGAQPKGDLDLSVWSKGRSPAETILLLRSIRDRVRSGEMPPPDPADPILAGDRESLWRWADRKVREHAPQFEAPAGRSTVRRLSRAEYANTLRDLFGVGSTALAQLPVDDLGYGFDNIGDAVTFSLLHLEKYQDVAADVASQVVSALPVDHRITHKVTGEDLTAQNFARFSAGMIHMYSRGTATTVVDVPRDGTYQLRIGASGDQAGDEPPLAEVLIDGRQVAQFAVTNPRNAPAEFRAEAALAAGHRVLGVRFPNDYYRKTPEGNHDRNLHVHWVEVTGPEEPWQPPAGAMWLHELMRDGGSISRPVDRAVRELMTRAWRRPPTAGEQRRMVELVDEVAAAESSLGAGLQAAVEATLLSPRFLFRIESSEGAGEAIGGGDRWLDDFELATRLSHFLWSSTPDDQLLAEALRGGLRTREQVRNTAMRMLEDPRAETLATHFAAQWLELRSLGEVQPDPDQFGVDRSLLRAMGRETELLFLDVLRRDLPVRELLLAQRTWVNGALARHYGIDGVGGEEAADGFVAVDLPPERRVGLLAHASVMTLTSNPTRTSPVKRGKWILDNILSAPPPPPPPGADSLEDESSAIATAASLRQQLAAHRTQADCASCHIRMDAIGLALENFDAVGRWREQDEGGPIDVGAELPDGRSIEGVVGLRDMLLETRSLERTVLRKLFVFAVGRAPTAADEVTLEARLLAMPGDVTLRQMVAEIVALDSFCMVSPAGAATPEESR